MFMKNEKKYFIIVVVVLLVLVSGGTLLAGTVTDPGDYSSGQLITAAIINDRFTALYNFLNAANIGSTNLSSDEESLNKVSGGVMTSSEGNIGIGTTATGALLDISSDGAVVTSNSTAIFRDNTRRATVRLRSETNNPTDFIMDVNGALRWAITSRASSESYKLLLYPQDPTTPNYVSTNSTPVMTWLQNGKIGIGTDDPDADLHIYNASGNTSLKIETASGTTDNAFMDLISGGKQWRIFSYETNHNFGISDSSNGQTKFRINGDTNIMSLMEAGGGVGIGTTNPGSYELYVNGDTYCSSGNWTGSDLRWKKNVDPLTNSLHNILKLQGVNYEWKTEEYKDQGFSEGKQLGLIAQDVEKIIPELVYTNDDGYKSVSYEKLTAVLVEGMKEQQEQIETQKNQIEKLLTQNSELYSRIETLENN